MVLEVVRALVNMDAVGAAEVPVGVKELPAVGAVNAWLAADGNAYLRRQRTADAIAVLRDSGVGGASEWMFQLDVVDGDDLGCFVDRWGDWHAELSRQAHAALVMADHWDLPLQLRVELSPSNKFIATYDLDTAGLFNPDRHAKPTAVVLVLAVPAEATG